MIGSYWKMSIWKIRERFSVLKMIFLKKFNCQTSKFHFQYQNTPPKKSTNNAIFYKQIMPKNTTYKIYRTDETKNQLSTKYSSHSEGDSSEITFACSKKS